MKKIFLGLLLLLYSMTAMSYNYCEGNHIRGDKSTYKSSISHAVMFTANNISTDMNFDSHYFENLETLSAVVQGYLQRNLGGITDSVVVNKTFTDISIYTKSGHESAVETKLQELNSRKSELDELIRKNVPDLVSTAFVLYNTDESEDLLDYTYGEME